MALTTEDLVQQVREQLDEQNEENLTNQQILNVLNRAQRKAANVTARRLDDMLLASHEFQTVESVDEYNLPPDIFGRRIESVEAVYNDVIYVMENIGRKDSATFRSQRAKTPVPYYYLIKGTKIQIVPGSSAGSTVRIWYAKKPDDYVLPQGRIVAPFSSSNMYIYVDAISDGLSTTGTSLNSYVNVVDWNTGEIKGTYQISAIDQATNKITLKSVPTRNVVLGRTISSELSSSINIDDYVCLAKGTAVAQLPEAYIDYQVQFTIMEIKRRYGEPTQDEYYAMKEYEKELQRMWSGRDRKLRVRKTNSKLGAPRGGFRRYYA